MAKENGFFNTVKRLFGRKDEEQNTSAGTSNTGASSVPATSQTSAPAQQAPVYKDNTVIKKDTSGQSGVYQYKAESGFTSKDEINQQYNYARSLGYDKQQALDLLKGGTRWKTVALGQNGKQIGRAHV